MKLTALKKSFVLQHDHTDCGVACLLMVTRYYGGNYPLEKLRELSGTNLTGTTLLGLYQCAGKIGFTAQAFEAGLDNIKLLDGPCILHVIIDNMQHYIVLYGSETKNGQEQFIVGDPARGIINISPERLTEIWKSKTLLQLKPNESFVSEKQQNQIKWQWFCKLLKEDINILVVTMILGVLITVLGLAMAIFSQKLIDNILPSADRHKLVSGLVLLFLVLSIRACLSYMRQYFLLLQSKDFNNRIVGDFFHALVRLPKSFFDRRKTGDMIARMNDTARIQRNIAYITGSVFIDIIIFLVTCFFLINYSPVISLIVFCFIPVLVFTVLSYTKPVKNKQRVVMASNALNESNYIDTIQGIAVIKSHNKEGFFTDKIRNIYGALQNETLELGKIGNNFSITTDFLSLVLNVILISVASFFVLNKQLKTGEMIAIISLVNSLIPAVARLSQINIQFQEANIAFDRMYDFTSIQPEYPETEGSLSPLEFTHLALENVAFRFPGRKLILKDISLQLQKGEMIALLGESGSGKSTIISILQKFFTPDAGDIKVNDQPLKNINTQQWRDVIATVQQDIKLFNGTLISNIGLGQGEEELASVISFCDTMGFSRFFAGFPQGYFTLVGEEGVALSGGQKQLVALARALYRKPQILLLDEATSAMDRNTEKAILDIIQSVKHSMAIFLITHRVQTAKIADRIYILEDGVIKDSGTPSTLSTRSNFYSQLITDVVVA
ncbi:peptidase domain-containing ABC transporter [Mucilaginibacter endophyticus]|uniref:peptidase domain-containing ABC transporter n=1 Tax=Mucilaginibacter endophyticus TaxID=2675003 RepID=UPI000E0D640E|nr:peptidase domain-containing ABC transporter [Mucilaginibacter endophyticus]